MRKNQKLFTVEITDTFGGEANYCWVRRYIVRASSERGAVCVVARQYGGNWVGTGDGLRYDQVGAAVCLFLEFCEDETQAIAHGYAPLNYTRKKTKEALPEHLFIASSGDLYDTRKPDWNANPLRKGYMCTKREIKTGADLRATLRAGSYAFPGGCTIALYTSAGEMVSINGLLADRGALYQALYDVRTGQHGRIVGADTYMEGPTVQCAYTGLPIESANGDPAESAEHAENCG